MKFPTRGLIRFLFHASHPRLSSHKLHTAEAFWRASQRTVQATTLMRLWGRGVLYFRDTDLPAAFDMFAEMHEDAGRDSGQFAHIAAMKQE